jgi:hypothetical protein
MITVRHIRTGRHARDRRTRGRRGLNQLTPTLCGAEPLEWDTSRKEAAHIVNNCKLRPDWIAEICVSCREKAGLAP